MRVRYVRTRRGEPRVSAAPMKPMTSLSEYRYGTGRWYRVGNSEVGGASLAGSRAWRYVSKPLTADKRIAHQLVLPVLGKVAQAIASSVVTRCSGPAST